MQLQAFQACIVAHWVFFQPLLTDNICTTFRHTPRRPLGSNRVSDVARVIFSRGSTALRLPHQQAFIFMLYTNTSIVTVFSELYMNTNLPADSDLVELSLATPAGSKPHRNRANPIRLQSTRWPARRRECSASQRRSSRISFCRSSYLLHCSHGLSGVLDVS